ncbi:MAG: SMC-Scp complex subunit ScpB [Halobacteriota archaeon]
MNDRDLVEAALFVAGRPLTLNELESIIGPGVDIEGLVASLVAEYQRRGAIEVVRTSDDVVMQVKTEYADAVRTIAQRDLETPVLRTLAVIAYHQPITQSKVAEIRGNKAYGHVHELEARKLIEAVPHGRTRMLRTTRTFVEYFGFETENLEEIKERIEILLR